MNIGLTTIRGGNLINQFGYGRVFGMKNFAIFGAGAVGGYFGGLLQRAGALLRIAMHGRPVPC